jgi:adenine-specific DNA-methyltransferase
MGSVLYKQSQVAVKYLRTLMGGKIFDNPKDHEILARLVSYCMGNDDSGLVMDFFAGSASSVEAVLSLNHQDGGTRQIVAVQLPEVCDEKSAALKAGYETIYEIGRDRIKRVIDELSRDSDLITKAPQDLGFRSFALTPSNFKPWRGDFIESPAELASQIEAFVKSEKDGARVEDMIYELMLKFGQELTIPVETLEVEGTRVFAIRERKMLFVLDGFSEPMIDALIAFKPDEVVALDSVFNDSDQLKTNFDLQCRDAGVKFTCI